MTTKVPSLSEALVFARHLHRDQVRKSSGVPYFAHLMAVAAHVMEMGGDADTVVAALLHDAIEDQAASYPGAFGMPGPQHLRAVIARDFGPRVLGLVEELTETDEDPKPPWRARKDAYLAHLKVASREAALIALADKIHNARATLRGLIADGREATWAMFNADPESQFWWYDALSDVFWARGDMPQPDMMDLDDIIDAMRVHGGPDAVR
jgi:(p)ppGpp synthase/HD superfamily hydrolase